MVVVAHCAYKTTALYTLNDEFYLLKKSLVKIILNANIPEKTRRGIPGQPEMMRTSWNKEGRRGWMEKGDHSPKYAQEDYAGRGSGACLQVGAGPGR